MKKKSDKAVRSASNEKYMGGMKVPGDFGDASKVMKIDTTQGHGGNVQEQPCQYKSSYAPEAYNYKY